MKVLLLSQLLTMVPLATGGFIAFYTPPTGVGCNTLVFLIYAGCQVAITLLALVRCAVNERELHRSKTEHVRYLVTGWRFYTISMSFWIGSFLAGVGGTAMQLLGVFRSCLCGVGVKYWYNISKINPLINLATDTAGARNASVSWIWMGSTASVFMALTCYIGWWYQKLIRRRFTDAVKDLYIPDGIEDVAVACEPGIPLVYNE